MKIYEKNAFMLHQHVGTGGLPDGPQYEMQMINGSSPAVKSITTGRTFVLGWDDIIVQAIAAGIDKEPEA